MRVRFQEGIVTIVAFIIDAFARVSRPGIDCGLVIACTVNNCTPHRSFQRVLLHFNSQNPRKTERVSLCKCMGFRHCLLFYGAYGRGLTLDLLFTHDIPNSSLQLLSFPFSVHGTTCTCTIVQ